MIYKLNGYGYSSNTYLILDKKNILIDPGAEETFKVLLNEIESITNNIDFIINTHCHYDHSSANYLVEEVFNSPTVIHDYEVEHLKRGDEVTVSWLFNSNLTPPKEIIPLSEVKLDFLNFIHTPGHTYGSISIVYKDNLITGDTLFSNSVGRWDLPTGDFESLKRSIIKLEEIAKLYNINKILPGHGDIGGRESFEYAKMYLGL